MGGDKDPRVLTARFNLEQKEDLIGGGDMKDLETALVLADFEGRKTSAGKSAGGASYANAQSRF